jgi:hypothetical protein
MGEAARETTGQDAGEATVWLSYGELAERLGIKPGSAKRRALERRWPRRPGNDGRARVAVPVEVLAEARETTGEDEGEDAGEATSGIGALADYLKGELAETRRELRATAAEAQEARERVARATGEAEALRETTAALRQQVQDIQAELKAGQAELSDARERAARAEGELAGPRSRGGLLARLWGRG